MFAYGRISANALRCNAMLGRYIHVRVTHPIHSHNRQNGICYSLNYGIVEGTKRFDCTAAGAYIMGVNRPVRAFDGRVIAILHRHADDSTLLVLSPRNKRYIDNEIRDAIAFAESPGSYTLECLYESSCGAVVYRLIHGELRFLLIRNKRSAHWGFPKGHTEKGETPEQTAIREVYEEAGIRIRILPGFSSRSEYTIQGKVEKSVTIFLARTWDTNTVIQREEIEDYLWLNLEKAAQCLRFENDKEILIGAYHFLLENGYMNPLTPNC